MSKNWVSPASRLEIREFAMRIRRFLGYRDTDFVNAPKLYDALANRLAKDKLNFDFRVMSDDDKVFENKEEAYTNTSTGIIYIKQSVMEKACRRSFNRAAFTLIHELGHFLLHYVQEDVKLARVSDEVDVPPYCDPEWQANVFASEFLMPFNECKKLTPSEIRKNYHVSTQASEVRYNKIKKELGQNSLCDFEKNVIKFE